MKIEERKLIAFIVTLIILVGLSILTIFFASDSWQYVCLYFILAISGNSIAFISFNVLAKFIISKYFKSELNDNGKEK